MANELTTLIMNNIVQKCSGYKSSNTGRSSSNPNPVGGKQIALKSGDVKNLTDIIHKSGKVSTGSSAAVSRPSVSASAGNGRANAKHLDDLIGKKVSSSLSDSTDRAVERTPVRSTSNNNMSLDAYLKGLKK